MNGNTQSNEISTVLTNIAELLQSEDSVEIKQDTYEQIREYCHTVGKSEDNITGVGYRLFDFDDVKHRYLIDIELHPDRVQGRGVYVKNINPRFEVDFEAVGVRGSTVTKEYGRITDDDLLPQSVINQLDKEQQFGSEATLYELIYERQMQYGKSRLYIEVEDLTHHIDAVRDRVECPDDVDMDDVIEAFRYGIVKKDDALNAYGEFALDVFFPDDDVSRVV
jgi:hypothetical protein